MTRRRGVFLLMAFVLAVTATGAGGVRAPWAPRPADRIPTSVAVAQIDAIMTVAPWGLRRME